MCCVCVRVYPSVTREVWWGDSVEPRTRGSSPGFPSPQHPSRSPPLQRDGQNQGEAWRDGEEKTWAWSDRLTLTTRNSGNGYYGWKTVDISQPMCLASTGLVFLFVESLWFCEYRLYMSVLMVNTVYFAYIKGHSNLFADIFKNFQITIIK